MGNFGGVRRVHSSSRKCIELVHGLLWVAKLGVICIVPSRVVWPPTPRHPELEFSTTILPIDAGVQDACDFEFVL